MEKNLRTNSRGVRVVFRPLHRGKAHRRPARASIIAVVCMLLAACGVGQRLPGTSKPPERADREVVTIGETGDNVTAGPWNVSASTRSGEGELQLQRVNSETTPNEGVAGWSRSPDAVRIEFTGAKLDTGTIRVTRQDPVPDDQSAVLAYLNEATGSWEPVPTELSDDRRTLTATTTHFSNWDDWAATFGTLISTRVDQPSCSGPEPAWVAAINLDDNSNTPLRWCAGRDPKNKSVLVVKVAANRGYGFAVAVNVKPAWVYTSAFSDSSAKDLLTAMVGIGAEAGRPSLGLTNVLLPPGMELHVGFTEASARKLRGDESLVSVSTNAGYIGGGIAYAAMEELAGDEGALATLMTVLAIQDCVARLGEITDSMSFGTVIYDCLTESGDQIARALVTKASQGGIGRKKAEKAAKRALQALKFLAAIRTAGGAVAGIAEWVLDRQQPSSAYHATLTLRAPVADKPTSTCSSVALARDLDVNRVGMQLVWCAKGWAHIRWPTREGDTDLIARTVGGRWRLVTGLPTTLCLVGAVAADMPREIRGSIGPCDPGEQFPVPTGHLNDVKNRRGWVLTTEGLGPLKIGMNYLDAQLTGHVVRAVDNPCGVRWATSGFGLGPGDQFALLDDWRDGSADDLDSIMVFDRAFPTRSGIRVGDSENELRRRLGDQLSEASVRVDGESRRMLVVGSRLTRVIFKLDRGHVSWMAVARKSSTLRPAEGMC